jgi:predicted RNA polymerase sigma factor
VTLNRAVAVSMAFGPEQGLAIIGRLLDDPAMRRHHRVHAVRAHLLELAGDLPLAVEDYRRAASLTSSLPEQRYLLERSRRAGAQAGLSPG